MRSEVTVIFKDSAPIRIDLTRAQAASQEMARAWLDRQFTELSCEPLRPTGKVLAADKVVVVAQAAGPARFGDEQWALQFGRAASAVLGKPIVNVDVPSLSITY